MNILEVTLDDLEDNEVQRLMYTRADGYRRSLMKFTGRIYQRGDSSLMNDMYHAAVNLYGMLTPATDAAMTTYWQYARDPENKRKRLAAECVLDTWREYCALAKELVSGLKHVVNED